MKWIVVIYLTTVACFWFFYHHGLDRGRGWLHTAYDAVRWPFIEFRELSTILSVTEQVLGIVIVAIFLIAVVVTLIQKYKQVN